MISATYFGEITELDSRAIWYSDEEDDDDDDDNDGELGMKTTPKAKPIVPLSHELSRSNVNLNFTRITTNVNLNFTSCIISLSSASQFKNFKLSQATSLPYLGYFDSLGKAFAFPIGKEQEKSGDHLLWLLFDSNHHSICGHEVGYLVESLLEKLQSEFNLNNACQILILSKQYSNSENLEYLSNCSNPMTKLTFTGRPILPPALIRSQFESALFEQSTLAVKPASIVCLPNPKNFWFDPTKNWPEVPGQIIDHRLNDDNLEKTLIFT